MQPYFSQGLLQDWYPCYDVVITLVIVYSCCWLRVYRTHVQAGSTRKEELISRHSYHLIHDTSATLGTSCLAVVLSGIRTTLHADCVEWMTERCCPTTGTVLVLSGWRD
jgi:hypothetical protein